SRFAPAQAVGRGFELERAGQYQRAATVYFTTLRGDSTNLAALLGLERVLPSLNRVPDLLPAAQRAVAASPKNAALRGLLLRTYVTLNEADSARVLAQRWAAEQPRDEAPYREWAIALQDAHRYAEARQVFLAGRRALGRRGAFGVELGELPEPVGEWAGGGRGRRHPRGAPGARARAGALRGDGPGAAGRAGPGRGGARLPRGGRPGRGSAGARAGGGRFHGPARRAGAGPGRAGGGADRGRPARRGGDAALGGYPTRR